MIGISRNIGPYIRQVREYFSNKSPFPARGNRRRKYGAAEVSRLIAQARRAEQERIARDLHDQVGQDMACLTMGLHLLKTHVTAPEGAAKLEHLLRLTDSLSADLHRVVVDIRMQGIEGGLVPMLRTMAADWSDESGVAVQLMLEDAKDLRSMVIDVALYRVCQECLTNVAKHATDATCVMITLRRTKKEIMLSIADDGAGFQPSVSHRSEVASNPNRYGLVGMRERLEMIGGMITITSEPSVGTQVVARVPLREG